MAGILIFSGVLLKPKTIQRTSFNGPEILLIHGERDEVIPLQALKYTKDILLSKKHKIETVICKGAGHSMYDLSMVPAIKFILDRI